MKILRFTLFCFVASWFVTAANAQQTIADLARQERARKKSLESKVVFSSETRDRAGATVVTSATSGSTADTAKTVAPAPKAPAAPTAVTDKMGRDEKYWRNAFSTARQDLKRAQDRLAVLELKVNSLNSELLRAGMATRENEIRAELAKTKTEQEATRKDVVDKQKALTDLDAELIRSGGLPGWAR